MQFDKLNTPTLTELFIKDLESKILSGRMSVGDKLPPERELATSMGVSRAVVNTGISSLAKKGFLTVKPRVGTFVADYRRLGTLDTLIAIMNYNGGSLKHSEIISILEVRLALDTLALQLCIPKITEEEINTLGEITERIHQAKSIKEAKDAAFDFQHTLAFYSGNTLIPLIFQSFRIPVMALWERFCELYGIQTLYENTFRLFQYIQNRDLEGALSWTTSYLEAAIRGDKTIFYSS